MTDVYASGSFDFRGGSFSTEYLAYVLGPVKPGEQPVLAFRGGSAKIYDLGPQNLFAHGSMAFDGGSALIITGPYGAFEDFAIYPETGSDPLDGFVVADNTGTVTGGVGQAWTRHYRVVVPPRKARFIVPHIRTGSMPDGNSQYFDAHQVEVVKHDATAPSAFESARSIQVTVRPARINYAEGNSLTVHDLIPGRTYTASAVVNGARESHQFEPTTSTWTLTFSGAATKILVEEGDNVGDFFDGSMGADYLWDVNGTPGATKSYYYPDRLARHYILVRTLQENVALGVSVLDPIYGVLPSPSTNS